MKKVVVLCIAFISLAARSQTPHPSAAVDFAPISQPWQFGVGYQISGSNLFLFSWQSPPLNPYDRTWRIEPMIGGSYSDNENAYPNTNASLTLGLGTYLRWRVRAPFDDLFFQMGPRLLVTGYRQTSTSQPYPDTLPRVDRSLEYLSTSLAVLAGPEYDVSKWDQHFSISGFFALSGTVIGRPKESPDDFSSLGWSLNVATSTGIVLRYYLR